MHKGTKYRHGLLPIPAAKGAKISRQALSRGLLTLEGLWKKGLYPSDLRKHFLFSWFALNRGRVVQQVKSVGLHRNTLVYLLQGYAKVTKGTIKLRRDWEQVCKKNPKSDFPSQLYLFYKKAGGRPIFSSIEGGRLVSLWLAGFPQRVLKAHYVLWALRRGTTKEAIQKRLGVSGRTLHRVRIFAARKNSPVWFWLSPMKPRFEEWYPHRKNW